MSVIRNISITYAGGDSAIQQNLALTGQTGISINKTCNGNATTTISPAIALDPDNNVRCFAFVSSGDCTVHFDLASGTDTSVALTANTPLIQMESASGTIPILPAPSGNDTMTIRIVNPGSETIQFVGDLLVE